jgi:hypothetical protein
MSFLLECNGTEESLDKSAQKSKDNSAVVGMTNNKK